MWTHCVLILVVRTSQKICQHKHFIGFFYFLLKVFYVSCMCETLVREDKIFFFFFLAQFTPPVIQIKIKISECTLKSFDLLPSCQLILREGKTVRENARGEGLSTLSLPQLTCMLSQAQRSFTSLINHINWSNKALAGQKFVLSAAKKLKCRKNPDVR